MPHFLIVQVQHGMFLYHLLIMKYIKPLLITALSICCVTSFAQNDTTFLQNVQDTTDKRGRNNFGDLLNDDSLFNKKRTVWEPAGRIVIANVFNWSVAKYVYKLDWPSNSKADWKNNFQKGPVWDDDGFGINFIGHPHTGSNYFNIARSNGYNFWQSIPFNIYGSVMWEYLGEKTRPSYNDLINTPVSGAFLGEILYRLSSNVLDDRTRGFERVWREILAGAINPSRAFNRFTQGKMFRVTDKEVYQKDRVNLTFNAGAHKINEGTAFATGATNPFLNIQIDYGSPFEIRKRKPFDVFRFKTELSYGANRKLLENVHGYGILAGKNINSRDILGGIFQHFDYWNNSVFEVGAIGFGVGVISRKQLSQKNNLITNLHIAAVPLAGNNTRFGPDSSSFRTYNYGGGMELKLEETINFTSRLAIGFNGFFYWIKTYVGLPGNSLVTVMRPNIAVRLFKNISIGFEQHIYMNDRFLNGKQELHLKRTEQKIFLQLFHEDPKRFGKYK